MLTDEFSMISNNPNGNVYFGFEKEQSDCSDVELIASMDAWCFHDVQTTRGCIVKNKDGSKMSSSYKKQFIYVNPCVDEAMGVRSCLELALKLKWNSILI